jgi:hypothetical protein
VAFHPLGWEPVSFSEIESFPNAVLEHHYPSIPNLGDMTKFLSWPEDLLAEVDMLVGGPPCFTEGHMVLTEKGYEPIESLSVGDRVVTHTGRLMPILRIGSDDKQVGILKGVGIPDGLECTPEHPNTRS